MKRLSGFVWALVILAGVVSQPSYAAEVVEEILAVVGDEVILRSELDEQVIFYCMQSQIDPTDTTKIKEVEKDLLSRMVDAKLVVNEARKQKLVVTPEELNRGVEDAVLEVKRRMGSEEKYLKELDKEGLTEEKLRSRYHKELEAQLLAMKLVDKEIRSKIKVTDEQVSSFFKERKGDFPKKPAEVTLAQIVILAEADSTAEEAARKRILELEKALREGEAFEKLAQLYSEDPSAQGGGDVGTFTKGEFEEEFEKVAFALEPGQISGPVRSRYGYHLIKLVERDENSAHVKHILIRVKPTEEAETVARKSATDLRRRIEAGESFAELAKQYSDDPETATKGGVVGTYPVEAISPAVKNAIKGVPVGGITDVVPVEIAFNIFKVVERISERNYAFDEVKDQVRQLVIQEKSQNKYEEWLAGLKKKTFIDIKAR
ncbi:MAG: peptidylprolyl isomerase [Candidatus Eisenbacteria bacterium]